MPDVALIEAVADIARRKPRDPRRLRALQALCAHRIKAAGGPPCATEVRIGGEYRDKRWDVGTVASGLPLAVSARAGITSRAKNLNLRLEDMLAEAVNVHRRDPQAVLGFLGVIALNHPARTGARTSIWNVQATAARIGRQCLRQDQDLRHELFDLGCLIGFNFDTGELGFAAHPGLRTFDGFCRELAHLWLGRRATAADKGRSPDAAPGSHPGSHGC